MWPRSPTSGPSRATPAAATPTGRWLPPAAPISPFPMGRRGPAAKPLPLKLAALLPALLLTALLAACNGEAPPEEAKQEETPKQEPAAPTQEPTPLLHPVDFTTMPGWADDAATPAPQSLKRYARP